MKAVVSPAKKLNEKRNFPEKLNFTEPVFKEEANRLVEHLKKLSPSDLADLMGISEKLAELNYKRFQEWITDGAYPAIFLYDGDTYKGLDIESFPPGHLDKLQDKVRIISGLYGVLRPLDLIMPYRLEMKTPLALNGYPDLKSFWRDKVTSFLKDDLKGEPLVNLASKEYFEVIDEDKLNAPVIHVDFKDFKGGKYKTIGLLAKRARGNMARWIAENNINSAEELKNYTGLEYRYNEEMSSGNHLVFTRN